MDCTLVSKGKETFVQSKDLELEDPGEIKRVIEQKASAGEVTLGIRPENIKIFKERSRPGLVEAQTYVLEPMGQEVMVSLMVGEQILRTTVARTLPLSVGERVWIDLDIERMHVFDKKTEQSIL